MPELSDKGDYVHLRLVRIRVQQAQARVKGDAFSGQVAQLLPGMFMGSGFSKDTFAGASDLVGTDDQAMVRGCDGPRLVF